VFNHKQLIGDGPIYPQLRKNELQKNNRNILNFPIFGNTLFNLVLTCIIHLGSTLLRTTNIATTNDNKPLLIFRIVIMITNIQKTKNKKKISQNFQNKICFHLLHYTNKNEKKGHECYEKKT